MRKRQRGPRPVSDEPLSAGRVEYLEQARERVRNRRIRRTALIVVALTLVVLFTTGIVGSSVAMAKDWADTARILLFPGTGWPQQTGVMEVKQLAAMNSSFVELGEEGCVVWSPHRHPAQLHPERLRPPGAGCGQEPLCALQPLGQ